MSSLLTSGFSSLLVFDIKAADVLLIFAIFFFYSSYFSDSRGLYSPGPGASGSNCPPECTGNLISSLPNAPFFPLGFFINSFTIVFGFLYCPGPGVSSTFYFLIPTSFAKAAEGPLCFKLSSLNVPTSYLPGPIVFDLWVGNLSQRDPKNEFGFFSTLKTDCLWMSYCPGPGPRSESESVEISISAFCFLYASTNTLAITDFALLFCFKRSER